MADFATAAELETFTGGLITDTPRATALLGYASAWIRKYTGQTLSQVAGDTVIFGESPANVLYLPQRPVTAVTSILVDSVATTSFVWNRWGTVYRLPRDTDWIFSDHIQVVYDHGYATTDAEYQGVKAVCLNAASRLWTINKAPQFDQYGNPTEAAGFGPEMFLSVAERELLRDLGDVPVG